MLTSNVLTFPNSGITFNAVLISSLSLHLFYAQVIAIYGVNKLNEVGSRSADGDLLDESSVFSVSILPHVFVLFLYTKCPIRISGACEFVIDDVKARTLLVICIPIQY